MPSSPQRRPGRVVSSRTVTLPPTSEPSPGEALVAELGIVNCGGSARYQSVGTDEGHRRRGLASHLLGVAARWAADTGCDRWVIVTEATNPAGAVYRRVGFEPDVGNAQAYRQEPS